MRFQSSLQLRTLGFLFRVKNSRISTPFEPFSNLKSNLLSAGFDTRIQGPKSVGPEPSDNVRTEKSEINSAQDKIISKNIGLISKVR